MAVYDPTTPGEIWYPIPSLPGYELSSDLRVRSFRLLGQAKGGVYGGLSDRWRPISIYPLRSGHLAFHVRIDGKARTVYLHHVVAEFAYGPTPPGLMILHRDDDKTNNLASNLGFGTQAINVADQRRNGRVPRHRPDSVTFCDACKIRGLLATTSLYIKDIAARFVIDRAVVVRINSGQHPTVKGWPRIRAKGERPPQPARVLRAGR